MRTKMKGIGAAGVLAASIAALSLAGCHPKELKRDSIAKVDISSHSDFSDDDDTNQNTPLKAVATLDCPSNEGALTRVSQAGDGKSCDYSGPGDETVHLSLLALGGKAPLDAVSPMKAELRTLVHVPDAGNSVENSKDEGGDHAKVDVPFVHVDANGNKAKVKIFGFQIDADDDSKTATVKGSVPGIHNAVVHAGPGGAEILAEDVGKVNTSLVYILAGDKAGTDGYHAVGYIARGPSDGPLVVGEFRAKGGHHGHEDSHGDIGRLIDRNVKP